MDPSCKRCGYTNREGAQFCARCGDPLDGSRPRRLSVRAGTLLKGGAYQVQGHLSRGGMGAVYLARDMHAFGRPCVIKEMLDYYDSADPDARTKAEARFREEGRILAMLSHPGIPKIYAFFEEEGRYFIVMEYILGENLSRYVTRIDERGATVAPQPISEEDLLHYAVQACAILEYLADQPRPVVHQDIKPANLIRERIVGDVRLVDFGTAGARKRQSGAPGTNQSSVYGTLGYAAPEQCKGAPVPRSDVYSLAATIYHLLTDDDPREHPGEFLKLDGMRTDLASALRQALRPDPARRSSARQLREHLEAIVMPHRTLHAFAFPGGDRIRTTGALPAMCDKHWAASRDYLYKGDFERWLRDLNRLDLVELTREARRTHRNPDEGLEALLHALDPGLPQPEVKANLDKVELGRVPREENITREIALRNVGRGYAAATVTASVPWVAVEPGALGLLSGDGESTLSIAVRTRELPLRGRHRAAVEIDAGAAGKLSIPITARISVLRELWREIEIGWRGTAPMAGAGLRRAWRWLMDRKRQMDGATKGKMGWIGLGHLSLGALLCFAWWWWTGAEALEVYAGLGLLGAPALILLGALLVSLGVLAMGLVAGTVRGLWRSFVR